MAYSRYYLYKRQYSTNNGETWYDVSPIETKTGGNAIATYTTLEECNCLNPQYRWVDSGTTCVGYDKYVKSVKEVSCNGVDWTNTGIESAITLIEQYSFDCMDGIKLLSIDDYGNISATPCNSTAALIADDVPDGYSTYVIGRCVTVINGAIGGSGTGGLYGKNFVECRIPNTVTTIGKGAFRGCRSLSSLTIPSSVTVISSGMCSGCSSMESVTLPNSITEIKESAFQGCSSLRGLVIPDSVTTLGSYCFSGCTSLTSATIGSGVTAIGASDFNGCTSLPSITIPNSVTDIKSAAFKGCTSLTSIEIPSSVTSISGYAFENCTSLTSVTVNATTPPTLDTYGSQFDNTNNCPIYVPCESVSVYKTANIWSNYSSRIQGIPPCETYRWVESGWTCVGYDKYVNNVQQVSYDGGSTWENTSNTSASTLIETNSTDCGYVPTKIYLEYVTGSPYSAGCYSDTTLSSSDVKVGGNKYSGITSAVIGDCVTTIGYEAFSGCRSLTSVTIPNSVTTIGDSAFYADTRLPSVEIPSGVTSIGRYAFSGCISTSSIGILDSVTNIDVQAFERCSSLTSVTIGSDITSIGSAAFSGCTSLTSVTVNATTPPSIGGNVFNNTNNCPIYVPAESVNTYKAERNWSDYASRIQAIPT